MPALNNPYVAVLDACVLAPMPDLPRWSHEILAETKPTIMSFGYTEHQAERRIRAMKESFPDAMVEHYEHRMQVMENDS